MRIREVIVLHIWIIGIIRIAQILVYLASHIPVIAFIVIGQRRKPPILGGRIVRVELSGIPVAPSHADITYRIVHYKRICPSINIVP